MWTWRAVVTLRGAWSVANVNVGGMSNGWTPPHALASHAMDSDDLFGSSSVWATSSATPPQPTEGSESATRDIAHAEAGFDDFDDFNEPTVAADDDFGDDFGDFGEAQEPLTATEFDEPVAAAVLVAEPESLWGEAWHPLRLEPFPPLQELSERVEELFAPIYDTAHLSHFLSDEGIRQAEGLNQTLVTPERCARCDVWRTLRTDHSSQPHPFPIHICNVSSSNAAARLDSLAHTPTTPHLARHSHQPRRGAATGKRQTDARAANNYKTGVDPTRRARQAVACCT